MTVIERAIDFACGNDVLVGVLALGDGRADTGLVIVVGGPQYRVGSHRQFVLMARRLAGAGFPVLRFDVRGMGDSTGEPCRFDAIADDIASAVDCLQRHVPGLARVVLCGLCDGASAALLYCQTTRDARVRGLCLLNPWVRSESSIARTHVKHYYFRRFRQPSFWRKLVSGRVAAVRVVEFLRSLRFAARAPSLPSWRIGSSGGSYQRRMAEAWKNFRGHILLVLSGRDFTAKEFSDHVAYGEGWTSAFDRDKFEKHELADADHTFSDAPQRVALEAVTMEWLLKSMVDPARSQDGAQEAIT